jgi:hypothetical protein
MSDGEHVSDEIVVELLGDNIRRGRYEAGRKELGRTIVLLDGFPMSHLQRTVFTQTLKIDSTPKAVIFLGPTPHSAATCLRRFPQQCLVYGRPMGARRA